MDESTSRSNAGAGREHGHQCPATIFGSTATYVITADGETYKITVSYGSSSGIPENAELVASEIVDSDAAYEGYVGKAAEALKEDEYAPIVNAARLFDIAIMADGEKIEPKAPVDVKIEYANPEGLSATSEVGAVHFKENEEGSEAEVLDVEAFDGEDNMQGISFKTDSFSIYAVVIIDKEEGTFVFEDENYRVTVSYTKEANIPFGTKLTVSEIDPASEQYDSLWSETVAAMNEGVEWENHDLPDPRKGLTHAVFFDVSQNYEGEDIEPDVPLGVKIEFKNGGIALRPDESARIVHFAENDVEFIDEVETRIVEVELPIDIDEGDMLGSFEYQQSSFSPLGAITTGEYIEINSISGAPLRLMAARAADAAIAASKTVTDTDGDGVYELALNVTGASESSQSTTVNKSNVVIVIDTSGSIDEYTYSPYTYSADTYDSNTTYYRGTGENAGTVRYWSGGYSGGSYHAAGWYYSTSGWGGSNWNSYSGNVYTRQTRMDATRDAAKDLVTALLANNRPAGTVAEDGTRLDDIVEISLITFANGTSARLKTPVSQSTSESDLHDAMDAMEANGGTNWEAALSQANVEAAKYASQTDETTSIIFLTDGVPTRRGYPNESSSPNGSETRDNTHSAWEGAAPAARTLITNGYKLYSIFAFGTDTQKYNNDDGRTDADYLRALVNYANTGSGSYSNTAVTQYVRDYFFNASDTTALTRAFQAIIDSINKTSGFGGVEYDDGVTLGVTNTSVAVDGTVHDESFRYKVTDSNGSIVYSVKIANGTATFDIPGKGTHTDNSAETVTTKIDENDPST